MYWDEHQKTQIRDWNDRKYQGKEKLSKYSYRTAGIRISGDKKYQKSHTKLSPTEITHRGTILGTDTVIRTETTE